MSTLNILILEPVLRSSKEREKRRRDCLLVDLIKYYLQFSFLTTFAVLRSPLDNYLSFTQKSI